jgi:mono/diheme cytochrome c family protein
MRIPSRAPLLCLALCGAVAGCGGTDPSPAPAAAPTYDLCVAGLQPTFADIHTKVLVASCNGCHTKDGAAAFAPFADSNPAIALAWLRDNTPANAAARTDGLRRVKSGSAAKSLLIDKLDASTHLAKYGALMPQGGTHGACPETVATIARWIDNGALSTDEGKACTVSSPPAQAADDGQCAGGLRCLAAPSSTAGVCGYEACGTAIQPTFTSIHTNLVKPVCSACHAGTAAAPGFGSTDPAASYAGLANVNPTNAAALAAGWNRVATASSKAADVRLASSFLYRKVLPGLSLVALPATAPTGTNFGAQMPRAGKPPGTLVDDSKNGSICPAAIDAVREWILAGGQNN